MKRVQAPSKSEREAGIGAMDVDMTTLPRSKNKDSKPAISANTPAKRAKTGANNVAESSFANQLADDHEKSSNTKQLWDRPSPPVLNPKEDPIVLQWIDIDVYTGTPLRANPCAGRTVPGNTEGSVPVVRLYGVLEQGSSVIVHVHGFTPYFFVEAPEGFTDDMCAEYRVALNARVRDTARASFGNIPNHIVAVSPVMKQSLQGYHGDTMRKFLQIYTALPEFVPTARTVLQRGFKAHSSLPEQGYLTYESNVPYVLRYMVDNDIVGANWLELPVGSYSLRSETQKTGLCQVECDIAYDSLISHPTSVPRWLALGPLRILSFDIECMGRRGSFPDPEQDPVIQIANFVTVQGESKARIRNIFVLGGCLPVVGADVISFDNEADLLIAWAEFVVKCDPDILTGYNVQNFDVPYLMKRATALKCIDKFALLGRIRNKKSVMKQTTFSSSAYGTRESTETRMPGRIMMDMIHYMWRNQKLSSYSLNAVSAEFLGQQKEDVHHSIISDLQRGSDEDRRRLAVYCLKDAYLPQQLMDKLLVVVNYVEMARVTGVPVDFLFTRGQQIKVLSMLYRKARAENLLIPNNPRTSNPNSGEVGYEGATVIEPKRGYYDTPIATLDFASLYPSIMMAHNLCYTTLIFPSDISNGLVKEGEYEKSPSGDYFVRASKKKGLLPTILEELLAARKRAKADMKKATDPMEKQVMNGRQLALKISANSVYGFTGATVGQLPCLPISRSVTSFGREMIDDTKNAVEKEYTIANGYSADADVIYGDTDSVMIKFGVDDVATAMKLGFEAAEKVTKIFPKPVALEFEKVYFPYLLMSKKRYAGLYWTKPEKWDKMDCKGIESVRRDNCQLARTVVDTCLRKILIERNVEDAIQYTKNTISALLRNKIDISLLIISKSLSAKSDDYKGKAAHVELAKRMHERDPNTAPKVGDRVPYVMIQTAKNAPGYEKSEDPLYVLENNIPIDTQFYLKNQLSKPLERLFDPIIGNSQSLLTGDHTKSVFKATPSGKVGLMRFAVKTLRCLGCKVVMSAGDKSALCDKCRHNKGDFYLKRLAEANALERKFAALWTQCQRCQGSLHQDVLCSNQDCPIFYMRKKVQQDLKTSNETLSRFEF